MRTSKSFLGRFFGGIWLLFVLMFRLVAVILFLGILVAVFFAFRDGAPVKVENNVALVINPAGTLVDSTEEQASGLVSRLTHDAPTQSRVRDVVEALKFGAKDSRIPLAVIKLDELNGAGMAQIDEILTAIRTFRAAGKPVYAYGDSFDQSQYLIASGADSITMDPMGELILPGLASYTNYYKDGLDKLGVNVNVFRVGEFKSAVEPFLRNDMSPDAKVAAKAWLADLWSDYNTDVANGRKLKGEPATAYAEGFTAGVQKFHGDIAAYAKDSGLIDAIEPLQKFRDGIAAKVGNDEEKHTFRQIRFDDYLHAVDHGHKSGPKIATVIVEGEIVDGRGQQDQAGADTIVDELQEVADDDDVSALVLRVNSPGGSVTGAEKIRRAIKAIQDGGTPVVVSMSTLAASGGYWISMDADEIWAHPGTITGSIGIFGMFVTIDQPLNKLGIHTDGVGTTSLAGAFRIDRPISPELKILLQSTIERGYGQFLDGVAAGRGMSRDAVEKIAEGRVWSGSAGKNLGLVDKLGGFDEAVASAAQMAGLKDKAYHVVEFEPQAQWSHHLLGMLLGGGARTQILTALFGDSPFAAALIELPRKLSLFNDPHGAYADCMCNADLGGRRH